MTNKTILQMTYNKNLIKSQRKNHGGCVGGVNYKL